MNKRILLLSACALLLTVSLLAGCAATTTTATVTYTQPGITRTVTTVMVSTTSFTPTTITQTYGTVTTVIPLTGPAPVIPHAATVEGLYGFCFNCHPTPAGHVGRLANQDLCNDCHRQGPVTLPQ